MATTKTTSTASEPAGTTGPTADDLKTEQEKGAKNPPADPPKDPEKAKPVEVEAKEPYPQGSPQDPEDAFYQAHGFRRAKE